MTCQFFSLLQERLTRLVSISLVGNPNLEDPNNVKRKEIIELCQQVSSFDPEFICKVCTLTFADISWFLPSKPSCLIFSRLLLFLSLSPLNSFPTIWSGNHLPLGFVRARILLQFSVKTIFVFFLRNSSKAFFYDCQKEGCIVSKNGSKSIILLFINWANSNETLLHAPHLKP